MEVRLEKEARRESLRETKVCQRVRICSCPIFLACAPGRKAQTRMLRHGPNSRSGFREPFARRCETASPPPKLEQLMLKLAFRNIDQFNTLCVDVHSWPRASVAVGRTTCKAIWFFRRCVSALLVIWRIAQHVPTTHPAPPPCAANFAQFVFSLMTTVSGVHRDYLKKFALRIFRRKGAAWDFLLLRTNKCFLSWPRHSMGVLPLLFFYVFHFVIDGYSCVPTFHQHFCRSQRNAISPRVPHFFCWTEP